MQVNNTGLVVQVDENITQSYVVDVDKNISQSYVVDVDQPRHHRGRDTNNVGKSIISNLKSILYKDDKEKLFPKKKESSNLKLLQFEVGRFNRT